MTRKQALQDLLAKVEAGEWDHNFAASWLWLKPGQRYGDARGAYDGSLDAAKALHEAVLPGWWWSVSQIKSGTFSAEVYCTQALSKHATARGDNPARSWLCAILKALIAECE